MKFIRLVVLLFACILPWQSVQAGVAALSADTAPVMAMNMTDDSPCQDVHGDCCDTGCGQMAFCMMATVAILSASPLLAAITSPRLPPKVFTVSSPRSVIRTLPLRPPISLAI